MIVLGPSCRNVFAVLFLFAGEPDYDPVQLFRHFDLATQLAICFWAFRGDAQHEFLIVIYRWNPAQIRRLNIDMAGGAHAIPAAFPQDPVDSLIQGSPHDRHPQGHVNLPGNSTRRSIGNFGHENPCVWFALCVCGQ
jgi:hypothetical protein